MASPVGASIEGTGLTTPAAYAGSAQPNPAVWVASALYNAGFRGRALAIMTAIAERESSFNPGAFNNNPSTGDYSVGLWQINYYGNLAQSRTQAYGTPQALLSNPQAQASAAYNLAGGNSLSGLSSAWYIDPATLQPTKPGNYSITKYLPSALAAADQVQTSGPLPASTLANASAWPSYSTSSANLTASLSTSGTSTTGCGGKPPVFGGVLGIGRITACNAKALGGGALVALGGVIIIAGLGLIIVAGLEGHGPAAPLVRTATSVTRHLPSRSAAGAGG